ncbi:MAG: hypothetical protein AAF546_00050 [Verrucomicrobiota bacterium]
MKTLFNTTKIVLQTIAQNLGIQWGDIEGSVRVDKITAAKPSCAPTRIVKG